MDKTNLIVGILTGISLIGVIGLLAIDKSTEVLLPIMTTLVGILVGRNGSAVAGYFRK